MTVLGVVLVAALAGGVAPAAALPTASALAPGIISTVAGGVGGPGRATGIALAPCGVSINNGTLYIGDSPIPGGAMVRQVSASDELTTPAGTDGVGPEVNGRPATKTALGSVCGTAIDHSGNLVLADSSRNRIAVVAAKTGRFYRRAMKAGDFYIVAGNGLQGVGSSGVPATRSTLGGPQSVAVDQAGNLVIADAGFQVSNRRNTGAQIRVVAASSGTFYGRKMIAGYIYTVAGYPRGSGDSGDGGPATKAALGVYIGKVRPDSAGNLVVADAGTNRVRVIAEHTGRFYGQAMKAGDIYTVAGDGGEGFSGDGGPATSAMLSNPEGLNTDAAGNLVIADTFNDRVRVVAEHTGRFYGRAMKAGDIYTVAGGGTGGLGDGGPATSAELGSPASVALLAGNVLIADTGNGRVRLVAESRGRFYGQAMRAGDIYTVAGNGASSSSLTGGGYSGDGGPATRAQLAGPGAVTYDGVGNMVITDTGNARMRVVAANTGTFYGQAMTARHIYTVAGNGTQGFSGDGGPATQAEIDPAGAAVDGVGNLAIADTYNERVRMVAGSTGTFYGQAMKAGNIYTVAGDGNSGFSGDGGPATSAELDFPSSVAVDASGNLLIADSGNSRVRVVAASTGTFYGQAMTVGDIYTVAGNGTFGFSGDGGPAINAELSSPPGIAVDASGNLLIADIYNERARVVAASTGRFYGRAMKAGDIYTVAGDGTQAFSGDGGPATKAALSFPEGVAADGAGNLLIADTLNSRVRVVAASTGRFYGLAMKAGDIYTVAGGGTGGLGDGGPGTKAELLDPPAVAVGASGDVVIADSGNNRIRLVTG